MVWLIVGAVAAAIAAVVALGFVALAASDPEGRGGNVFAIAGPICAISMIAFATLLVAIVVRAFS